MLHEVFFFSCFLCALGTLWANSRATMPQSGKNTVCMVYNYAGKVDLSKGCWNLTEKLGMTTHFL